MVFCFDRDPGYYCFDCPKGYTGPGKYGLSLADAATKQVSMHASTHACIIIRLHVMSGLYLYNIEMFGHIHIHTHTLTLHISTHTS